MLGRGLGTTSGCVLGRWVFSRGGAVTATVGNSHQANKGVQTQRLRSYAAVLNAAPALTRAYLRHRILLRLSRKYAPMRQTARERREVTRNPHAFHPGNSFTITAIHQLPLTAINHSFR